MLTGACDECIPYTIVCTSCARTSCTFTTIIQSNLYNKRIQYNYTAKWNNQSIIRPSLLTYWEAYTIGKYHIPLHLSFWRIIWLRNRVALRLNHQHLSLLTYNLILQINQTICQPEKTTSACLQTLSLTNSKITITAKLQTPDLTTALWHIGKSSGTRAGQEVKLLYDWQKAGGARAGCLGL